MPHDMFIYQPQAHSLFSLITAPSIVCARPKGGPIFFTYAKGGPEKIGDQPSQTDAPPPGKKWWLPYIELLAPWSCSRTMIEGLVHWQ